MSTLPEVAQPSGMEVNHAESAPTAIHYYNASSPHQYDPHQLPLKGEYMSVSEHDPSKPADPPLVCGVRRSTFWLAVILAIVVIAAAVGGGVGGSLAVSYARSNTNSSSPPSALPARETITITPSACLPTPSSPSGTSPSSAASSFYTPTPPRDVLRINVACPSPTLSSTNFGDPLSFKCVSNMDASNNDLMWFTAYTLQACIDGCAAFNRGLAGVRCAGVAIAEDLSHQAVVNSGANCWLKGRVNESEFTESETNSVAWLVEEE